MASNLIEHLKRIRDAKLLDGPSPIHVGAFFYGYAFVAPQVNWLAAALDARFGGPPGARAWTRAYLIFGDDEGFAAVLEAAIELLAGDTNSQVPTEAVVLAPFLDVAIEAIRAQRPAMVLAEPTIAWLHNFWLGAQGAADDNFAESAELPRSRLLRFEQWLQQQFDAESVPWQRILRANFGPGERAIGELVRLWDEHLVESGGERAVGG